MYLGVRGSVWDTKTSRERVGDWGGPETVWALLCVAERCATHQTESWGIVLAAICWANEHPEAVSPRRGVVLTDLSSIDMYNNDVGKKSAQKFMKQTGDLKAATLYFAS